MLLSSLFSFTSLALYAGFGLLSDASSQKGYCFDGLSSQPS